MNKWADHKHIKSFLSANPLGVISTVSKDGKPWGSAIYYMFDDEFSFYFITHESTAKSQNLDSVKYGALTVANNISQQTVQAFGPVLKLDDYSKIDTMYER